MKVDLGNISGEGTSSETSWSNIEGKPFESLNSSNFLVQSDTKQAKVIYPNIYVTGSSLIVIYPENAEIVKEP